MNFDYMLLKVKLLKDTYCLSEIGFLVRNEKKVALTIILNKQNNHPGHGWGIPGEFRFDS